MATYEDALLLAVRAHAGQVRKGTDDPYIVHPIRVAKIAAALLFEHEGPMADFERLRIAAILHDTLEDDPSLTIDLLITMFGVRAAQAVFTVTREDDESYMAFIYRIAETDDEIAVRVKLADLEDNMSTLPDGHSLLKRYRPAHALLKRTLTALRED